MEPRDGFARKEYCRFCRESACLGAVVRGCAFPSKKRSRFFAVADVLLMRTLRSGTRRAGDTARGCAVAGTLALSSASVPSSSNRSSKIVLVPFSFAHQLYLAHFPPGKSYA